MTNRLVVAAILALAAGPAFAHNPPFVYRPPQAPPTTNIELATAYDQYATKWRAEAAYHRQMAIDYRRFSKSPANPAIARMDQHCRGLIVAAERNAASAQRLATEYRLAGKGN